MSSSIVVRTCTLVLGFTLAGCYSLQPVRGTEPETGKVIAFDVNDAGRVALGGSMGPEIGQIEGQLLEHQNGSYLVAVRTVRTIRGGEQVWSGEEIRLKREYVVPVYERRFSPGRTAVAGAVAVGGFTAFMATRSLLGLGSEDKPEPPPDSVNTRIGRP